MFVGEVRSVLYYFFIIILGSIFFLVFLCRGRIGVLKVKIILVRLVRGRVGLGIRFF